jgi:DNA repair ATPase RecN
MLKSLHLRHVGSAPQLDMELADRLNIITGDNGLGKSFLLDVAWWALTGTWVDQFALPRREEPGQPQIRFQLADSHERSVEVTSAYQFDRFCFAKSFYFGGLPLSNLSSLAGKLETKPLFFELLKLAEC